MTAPTREQVLEWAEKAGLGRLLKGNDLPTMWHGQPIESLDKISALAYAAGQEAERIELQTEMQRLTELAQTAEKWRGIAMSRDGDGQTVQMVRQEAVAAEREACATARLPNSSFHYRSKPGYPIEYDNGFCDGVAALREAIRARSKQ